MNKKVLLLITILNTPTIGYAGISSGSLSFSWQGIIPDRLVADSWDFVDILGNPYVPSLGSLEIEKHDDSNNLIINSSTQMTFSIKSKNSKTLNGITAYLAAAPVTTGLVNSKQLSLSQTESGEDNVQIVMNGKPLKIGSSTPTSLDDVSGSEYPISISLKGNIAGGSYIPSSSINISVPIVFSTSLTDGAHSDI